MDLTKITTPFGLLDPETQDAGDALANLVRDALIFANWAAGECLCPEGIPAPEDFLTEYSDSTGDEDWETFSVRISAAIRALSMPERAQAWRVKPLEWKKGTWSGQPAWFADSPFGCWSVIDHTIHGNGIGVDDSSGNLHEDDYPTIEAAKAAAQADYAARILAALIPDTEGGA